MLSLTWETIYMCALVSVASYFLHKTAYKNGDIEHVNKSENSWDEGADWDSSSDSKPANLLIKKWLDFGGGYYGIVAFVKLVIFELQQLLEFVHQWITEGAFPLSFGSHLIADFFAQQIQAFVAAIIWPTDYLSAYSIFACAIFVAATYVAYRFSAQVAKTEALKV